ncbi:S-layer homology domain-containing protein [Paenibacillus catalpae]|uniref:S-layer homology domain-containing protein n=1 Tax=Paenibacillus catalpae TaxID=1045775 RepID=UPI000A6B7260|nr:S-layer homology domain-containing protein [Paenibacillus catalpae]
MDGLLLVYCETAACSLSGRGRACPASGIINGNNGNLTPQNNLTRAEAAKVLHLLYNELY